VTLNTDNRLMSGITMSSEFETCAKTFNWGLDDMEWLTLNAAKSAFYQFDQRLEMINTVIKPGYAALRAEGTAQVASR
jgi:adenosine deaminase